MEPALRKKKAATLKKKGEKVSASRVTESLEEEAEDASLHKFFAAPKKKALTKGK